MSPRWTVSLNFGSALSVLRNPWKAASCCDV
jgi:hypothetical protein